jgi:HK97 family phage major capsid protein
MRTLAELRQALGLAVDELATEAVLKDATLYEAKEKEIADLRGLIDRTVRAQAAQAALAKPIVITDPAVIPEEERDVGEVSLSSLVAQSRSLARIEGRGMNFHDNLSIARKGLSLPEPAKRFKSLGENLQAIQQHALSRGANSDARLVRAPTGAGEFDPTAGGFLVQVDFIASIFMLAHAMGDILSRVNTIPISQFQRAEDPGRRRDQPCHRLALGRRAVELGRRRRCRHGIAPKFRLVEFDLKKLISKMTVTDELLADTSALTAIASQAFSEEIMFMSRTRSSRARRRPADGLPQQPRRSISVAKETGQAAANLVKENLDKMWSRMWARSRQNVIWLINQDIEPQLLALSQASAPVEAWSTCRRAASRPRRTPPSTAVR